MDSILNTIKKMLGFDSEYNAFDTDIIVNINSALDTLNQIGVGLRTLRVTGPEETWSDFFDSKTSESAKLYVYLSTRLIFDPPGNSFVVTSIQKQMDELVWRMNVDMESR